MSTSSASSSSASGGECLPSTCGTGDVCCLDTTTKLTACEMGTACSGGGIELCTANADCASSGSVCAPLWAAIFVWELARPPIWLLGVFLLTAVSAHGLKVLVLGRGPTHAG